VPVLEVRHEAQRLGELHYIGIVKKYAEEKSRRRLRPVRGWSSTTGRDSGYKQSGDTYASQACSDHLMAAFNRTMSLREIPRVPVARTATISSPVA